MTDPTSPQNAARPAAVAPRYSAWFHLHEHAQWPDGIPDWSRDHQGQMNDITAMRAVIEELAALAQPSVEAPAAEPTEVRADGVRVPVRRWEWGIRRIVAILWGNRHAFEVDEVVDAVRKLAPPRVNEDGSDDEGLVAAAERGFAPPAAVEVSRLADEAKRLAVDALNLAESTMPSYVGVTPGQQALCPALDAIDRLASLAQSASEPAARLVSGEAVTYTEREMYEMQEAGTLPDVQAWLTYCKGEPHVQPELRRRFGWCQFHTPVWMPLVFQRAATPFPAAGAAKPVPSEAQKAVAEEVPFGYARTHCTPDTPMGAAEYDIEMVEGDCPSGKGWFPLYTHPAASTNAAQVLTEAKALKIWGKHVHGLHADIPGFATAIQRAFAEKNGLRLADGEANHG